MTKLRITVDGVTAVAELKDAAAPNGVAAVLATLPLRARVVHASRSGNCAVVHDAALRDETAGIEGQVSMYYPAWSPTTPSAVTWCSPTARARRAATPAPTG